MTDQPGTELDKVFRPLPTHQELSQHLQDGVNAGVAHFREQRGTVTVPEDVFPTVRWLQEIREKLENFGRSFAGAAALVGQYVEEELAEGVGEQDGIPTGPMKVPDLDGTTIELKPNHVNEHHVDVDALYVAIAHQVLGEFDGTEPEQGETESWEDYEDRYRGWMVDVLVHAMKVAIGTGAPFRPGVTKVRELARQLSMAGEDAVAATVTSAIRTTRVYKGSTMERKTPTPKGKK